MAKKKVGAKKVVRKTTKQVPRKPALVVEPDPVPVKATLPAVESAIEVKITPKVAATAPVSEAKVVQGAIAERRWPGIEKGYPDPFDVENEGTTATHRIFALKKEVFLQGKYPAKKIIIPLG